MLESPLSPTFLAHRPWIPAVAIAVVHFCVGVLIISNATTAHDEGQLMLGFSKAMSVAFLPTLFWQKAKPALALLYLPTSALGYGAYCAVHLLIGSAAVAAIGEVARVFGHRRPWLASAIVALSPLYTWSCIVGVSNSDGVAFMIFFLYACVVLRRPLLAGALLGVLPWIRFECAVFSAIIGLFLLIERRDLRFLVGISAWPVVYTSAGAAYHGDLLWFLHFSPGVSAPPGENVAALHEFSRHSLTTLSSALAMVTPALWLAVSVRPRSLTRLELALAAFGLSFMGLFAFTHLSVRSIGPAFALGLSARYAMIALPSVALLVGRSVEAGEVGSTATVATAGLLAAGAWARRRGADVTALWAAATSGFMIAANRIPAPALATGAALGLASLGLLPNRAEIAKDCAFGLPWATAVASWMEEHRSELGPQVCTNSKLLPLYLQRSGRLSDVRTRFLFAADMSEEITLLTNERNGQRARVFAAVPKAIFGDVVMLDELDVERIADRSIFVLTGDSRTKLILPPAIWNAHLEQLALLDGVAISRFRRVPGGP